MQLKEKQKTYKKYKMLTVKIKSIKTFVIIATTNCSVTLSVTTIGSIVLTI